MKNIFIILLFISSVAYCQDTSFKVNGDTVVILHKPKVILNTFYVSPTGNDANNGTSPATAWKTIAKVNSSPFKAGDFIFLQRGAMWREQLTIPASGIVIGAYGSGARPIINGADIKTGWTTTGNNIWSVANPNVTNSRAMVVIGGIIYSEASALTDLTSTNKYFISNGSVYVYSITDPSLLNAEISARDYGIITASGANSKRLVEIDDIEVIYAGRAGIYFEGPGNAWTSALDGSSIVRRCFLYANRSFGAAHVDHYNNVLFEDCIATFNGNGLYSWQAAGGTFRRDTTSDQIHYESTSEFTDGGAIQGYQADNWVAESCVSNRDYDAVHLDCGGMPCHGTIRYNKVYNSRAGSPDTPCGGVGSLGVGGIIDIYYNLFVNGASSAFESYSIMNDKVNFFNNTCYNSITTGTAATFGNFKSGINWNIQNNIFAREYVLFKYNMINVGALPTTLDNNCYFIYGTTQTMRNFYGTAYTTMQMWRTATGKEVNSINVDPLFVNKISDWNLQAGSLCINKGAIIGLLKDINGKPIVGQPDMGCYEYQ